MAKKIYEEENIRAIAEKIREKTGEGTTYKVSEMPDGIERVFKEGKSQGTGGYDEGYEAGQKAEYDRFWDNFQENGNRTNYQYGFKSKGWTNENFKPKYPIKPTDGSYIFDDIGLSDFDFVEKGIILDTSKATTLTYMCREAKGIKRLGVIDCSACKDLNRLFYGCYVVTIDNFIVKESLTYSSTFIYAGRLENIRVSGVIGNDISFDSCNKLTHDSLMSIINALKDNSIKSTLNLGNLDYTVEGYYDDPKGIDFNVSSASLTSSTLILNCFTDNQSDITIKVYGVSLNDDVSNIKGIRINYVDYDEENVVFTVDIVLDIRKAEVTKKLTLGAINLEKLTESEKKKATDKGWILA